MTRESLYYKEVEEHLLLDEKPSIFLDSLDNKKIMAEVYPFTMLGNLMNIEQSKQYHPEGSVWKHTLLVVDEAARRRDKSEEPRTFMWAALLHDIGKATTTKIKKGKITSYNHDSVGAEMAKEFLLQFNENEEFINNVTALVRWHMQSLFVVKELPFAKVEEMLSEVSLEEISRLSLCDRLGRGGMTLEKSKEEKGNISEFVSKCKKIGKALIIFIALFSTIFNNISYAKEKKSIEDDYTVNMKRDILTLMISYPGYISNIEKRDNGNVYLVMKSGNKILYDDKKTKKAEEKIYNSDLQDMLEVVYPLEAINKIMPKNFDPGRARNYPLLKEVYGNEKGAIQKKLVNVRTNGGFYQFNGNNGAAKALENTIKDINTSLAKKNMYSYVYPMSGTFNYRCIAGTGMLSPHSFGIAIDLARDKRDYWKWSSEAEGEKRISKYPKELVQCFENNNFIWGGKWGHFDILHFEYRPELIIKAKYFGKDSTSGGKWYDGIPEDNNEYKSFIDLINQILY